MAGVGWNPGQARARVCETQVYLRSSTYEDVSRDWMLTSIYGHDGSVLAQAREFAAKPCPFQFCNLSFAALHSRRE